MSYTCYSDSNKLLPLQIRLIRTIKRLSIGPSKGRESCVNSTAIRYKGYITLQSINNLYLNKRLIDTPSKKQAISSLSYKEKAKKHPTIMTRLFIERVSGYIQVAYATRLQPVTKRDQKFLFLTLNKPQILSISLLSCLIYIKESG